MKPYRGRRSMLVPNGSPEGEGVLLDTWRETSHNKWRARAVRELAHRLERAGIVYACGPILSGALFAQAIADAASCVRAGFLRKPGYRPEKHTINHLPWRPFQNWVFVDDVVQSGISMRRAAREIGHPPKAVIVLVALQMGFDRRTIMPMKWRDTPLYILRGRM